MAWLGARYHSAAGPRNLLSDAGLLEIPGLEIRDSRGVNVLAHGSIQLRGRERSDLLLQIRLPLKLSEYLEAVKMKRPAESQPVAS